MSRWNKRPVSGHSWKASRAGREQAAPGDLGPRVQCSRCDWAVEWEMRTLGAILVAVSRHSKVIQKPAGRSQATKPEQSHRGLENTEV